MIAATDIPIPAALRPACPACQAGPGVPCSTADGAPCPPHQLRRELARTTGQCPTCGAGPLEPCQTIYGRILLYLHWARRQAVSG